METLKGMRTAVGVSAYELAKRAGISASRYSYIERGIERPTEDEIENLASVLSQCAIEAKERLKMVTTTRLREAVE